MMSAKHLGHYLAEFEARCNMGASEGQIRVDRVPESSPGLRLTYERLIA